MPEDQNRKDVPWETVSRVVAFVFGMFLLYRTPNPNTVLGFVSLVLMGFLPAGIILRFFNGGGKKD